MAAVPVKAEGSEHPSLKEKVLDIPPQSLVEVRLRTNQKLQGRLGEVSDEGLILKVARTGKIEDRKVTFAELKSIRVVQGKAGTAGKVALGGLAAVGVIVGILGVILLIALAAR
jgi:hypothetical protein